MIGLRRGVAVVAGLLVVACAGGVADRSDPVALTWEPMEDLNAALPAGVRVYSGVDSVAPLRAWYVRARPGDGVELGIAAAVDTDVEDILGVELDIEP